MSQLTKRQCIVSGAITMASAITQYQSDWRWTWWGVPCSLSQYKTLMISGYCSLFWLFSFFLKRALKQQKKKKSGEGDYSLIFQERREKQEPVYQSPDANHVIYNELQLWQTGLAASCWLPNQVLNKKKRKKRRQIFIFVFPSTWIMIESGQMNERTTFVSRFCFSLVFFYLTAKAEKKRFNKMRIL